MLSIKSKTLLIYSHMENYQKTGYFIQCVRSDKMLIDDLTVSLLCLRCRANNFLRISFSTRKWWRWTQVCLSLLTSLFHHLPQLFVDSVTKKRPRTPLCILIYHFFFLIFKVNRNRSLLFAS